MSYIHHIFKGNLPLGPTITLTLPTWLICNAPLFGTQDSPSTCATREDDGLSIVSLIVLPWPKRHECLKPNFADNRWGTPSVPTTSSNPSSLEGWEYFWSSPRYPYTSSASWSFDSFLRPVVPFATSVRFQIERFSHCTLELFLRLSVQDCQSYVCLGLFALK